MLPSCVLPSVDDVSVQPNLDRAALPRDTAPESVAGARRVLGTAQTASSISPIRPSHDWATIRTFTRRHSVLLACLATLSVHLLSLTRQLGSDEGGFATAAAGDQVGFLLGRRWGPRLFNRPDSRLFSRTHAQRAHHFFTRHGSKTVVLARFLPVVRSFTPVVAGAVRMPYRRFTFYNLAGALLWAVGILTAGYFLGGVPIVAAHVELIAIAMVALSLVPAGLALAKHRRNRAPDINIIAPNDLEPVAGHA